MSHFAGALKPLEQMSDDRLILCGKSRGTNAGGVWSQAMGPWRRVNARRLTPHPTGPRRRPRLHRPPTAWGPRPWSASPSRPPCPGERLPRVRRRSNDVIVAAGRQEIERFLTELGPRLAAATTLEDVLAEALVRRRVLSPGARRARPGANEPAVVCPTSRSTASARLRLRRRLRRASPSPLPRRGPRPPAHRVIARLVLSNTPTPSADPVVGDMDAAAATSAFS